MRRNFAPQFEEAHSVLFFILPVLSGWVAVDDKKHDIISFSNFLSPSKLGKGKDKRHDINLTEQAIKVVKRKGKASDLGEENDNCFF